MKLERGVVFLELVVSLLFWKKKLEWIVMVQFLSTASLMGSVYDSYKDKDGFLYSATAARRHLAALVWPDLT